MRIINIILETKNPGEMDSNFLEIPLRFKSLKVNKIPKVVVSQKNVKKTKK